MGFRIGTNLSSMNAQRALQLNNTASEKTSRHLSEGKRITEAADDAAGLSISSEIGAKARSLKQAARNTQDGISLVQVMEGSFQEIASILVRFRELAIHAASDTIADPERKMINREVVQLKTEIDRIADSAEFNGKKLLSGGGAWPKITVQVGSEGDASSRIEIDRSKINGHVDYLGLHGIDFSTKKNAQDFLKDIDTAINLVSGFRASLGAIHNRFSSTLQNLMVSTENLLVSKSRIVDADLAVETAEQTKQNILSESGISILSQANQNPKAALKLLS